MNSHALSVPFSPLSLPHSVLYFSMSPPLSKQIHTLQKHTWIHKHKTLLRFIGFPLSSPCLVVCLMIMWPVFVFKKNLFSYSLQHFFSGFDLAVFKHYPRMTNIFHRKIFSLCSTTHFYKPFHSIIMWEHSEWTHCISVYLCKTISLDLITQTLNCTVFDLHTSFP